jgi:hypothetical protein
MSRDEILEIYASSISGGGFPAQLQEIIFVTEQKRKAFASATEKISSYYIPDLCMGTSGGNVALYIAISGNWDEGGIKRVINSMSPEMFSQTWWPGPMGFIPTWVLGIFEGAVYRPGYGASSLLNAYNTPVSITSVEMWNSAYNKNEKKTALFCNKKENSTFVSQLTYSNFECKTLPLNYLNGDINKISTSVIASASVPYLFKPVIIDNNEYIDGGVTYPSPFSIFQEEIYKCVKGIIEPYEYEKTLSTPPIPVGTPAQYAELAVKRAKTILHITYFSSYDIDGTQDTTSTIGTGNALSAVTDSSAVKDRYTGINLLERVKESSQNVKVIDSRTNMNTLAELFSTYNSTHYFCQVYVRNNEWIDLNKFTSQDILDKMNDAKSQIEFLFFYVD